MAKSRASETATEEEEELCSGELPPQTLISVLVVMELAHPITQLSSYSSQTLCWNVLDQNIYSVTLGHKHPSELHGSSDTENYI